MPAARRLTWYWHRLRAMDAREIAGRTVEQARSWTEPLAQRALAERVPALGAPAAVPLLPDRGAAPAALRSALHRDAATLRKGRWQLFGWREVTVPTSPQWDRDYVHDVSAVVAPGRRVDHRRLGGADARCVWETNRWAEVVRLAQHAWVNGAPDDARLAQAWLADWTTANPLGAGVNWTSALEAAIRLINFCWADALVRACGEVCGDAELGAVQDRLAAEIVPGHAAWIWRHRSFGSSANNHLLGELAALVVAVGRWPAAGAVSCTAGRAWAALQAEALRQFAPDGGNREQALHYHHFAWEIIWHAARAAGGMQPEVADRMASAAQFFCDLVHEREPWDFGDSDDAQLVPITTRRASGPAEWKAWLLGRAEGDALRFWLGAPPPGLRPAAPNAWLSYAESGYAAYEGGPWRARVDASPLGFGRMAAHGHLDALHASLWVGPHALVVDPGTGAYFGDPALRATLASWEMHNGPIPATASATPKRLGVFLWGDHHATPTMSVRPSAECVMELEHDGHTTRRVLRHTSGDWVVEDEVTSDAPHVVRWRLSPDWSLDAEHPAEFTFVHTAGASVRLTAGAADLVACAVTDGILAPHFGDLRRGPVVELTFRRRLESRWHLLQHGTNP